jgi:pimeloyl-ACP methyl ester carboxylesterase
MKRLPVLLACALAASCCPRTETPPEGLYQVSVESGRRRTVTGNVLRYDLFIPSPESELPPPPWPALVLTHGFARNRSHHRDNAMFLARRGIVVLTPDTASLLGGEPAQLDCIADLVDHVAWLAARGTAPADALDGLIDPGRIGLAGHSAGGAISFEAAIDARDDPSPVAAVCLLDAVPWPRTIARAGDFPSLPLASWRSEPHRCNAEGQIRRVLESLPFQIEDVLIIGATHCDPENPSDALCDLACGCSTNERQSLYQTLLYLFVRDALQAPAVAGDTMSYEEALEQATDESLISRFPGKALSR